MSDFGVSIKIKDLFFDRQKVIRAMDRADRKALSKAGAFIRTTARSSIKTRSYTQTSKPGEPPFDHAGFALARENKKRKKAGQPKRKARVFDKGLKAILFGYDPANRSVVVGPLQFGGKSGTSTVPHALEFGGNATIGYGRSKRVASIRMRPFMAPALKKELPNLPPKWRVSVSA